jgi:hypothetical protein
MALAAVDYIKPLRHLGGGCIPTITVNKTAVAWNQGDIIVHNAAGYAARGADDPTVATVLGVALGDATAASTTAEIVPALPGVTFWARIAADDAGATQASAVTQRYLSSATATAGYEFSLGDVSDVFFINIGESTTPCVMIINLIDPAGTAWGAVEFVFTASAFNAIT